VTVFVGNVKAKKATEITCVLTGKRGRTCARTQPGGGAKFKGKHKCWGFPSATWTRGSMASRAYGPGLRRVLWGEERLNGGEERTEGARLNGDAPHCKVRVRVLNVRT